jgi:hypothetical protein
MHTNAGLFVSSGADSNTFISIGRGPGRGDASLVKKSECLEVKLRGQVVSAEHCKTIIIVHTYLSSFD